MRAADGGHLGHGDFAAFGRITEDEEHGRALADGGLQLRPGADLDESDPHQAHRVVVDASVGGLHEHFVGHAGRIWQARHLLGVRSRHTGRRYLGQRRGAAIDDESPLTLHEPGQPGAHGLGQLVEVDVAPRRFQHRVPHCRQEQSSLRPQERLPSCPGSRG